MSFKHTVLTLSLFFAVAASGCGESTRTIDVSGQNLSDAAPVAPSKSTETDTDILPQNDTVTPATNTTTPPAPPAPSVPQTPENPPAPVCVPETDSEFCARLAKDCDAVTAIDNCGAARTADCGTCTAGFTCGGETANVCASVTAPYCYNYDFVSTRNGYENIYSTSTCSKEAPKNMTNNTHEETHFRNLNASEDGTKITYDYIYAGALDWQMSIDDVASLSGGENISGCRSVALNPADDRAVYVCSTGLYITSLADFSVSHLIASDNGDTRVFEKATWSPVKTQTDISYDKVVFSAQEADGSNDFYVYDDAASGKQRPLYEDYSGNGHDVILKGSSADISPDGKTLTFVRKNTFGGQEQVWACDLMFDQTFTLENSLSTSISHVPSTTKESLCVNPRVLTSEGNNSTPHWTSNGKHIFFTSDRDGNKEIYVMKADGSDESDLTQGSAADRDVAPLPMTRAFDPAAADVSASRLSARF